MTSTSICFGALQTGVYLQYFAVCLQRTVLSPRTRGENDHADFQFLFIEMF